MHHPYLVCILFGMPSLHLFTFFNVLFLYFFDVNLSIDSGSMISVTVRPKPKKNVSSVTMHNTRTWNSIDSLVVIPGM